MTQKIKPPISAIDVSNYLLSLDDEDCGDVMSIPHLNNLLYYCQGVHLAMHGKPLFKENIRRNKNGFVVDGVTEHFMKIIGEQKNDPPHPQ